MIDGTVLTVSSVQYYRDNGTYSCIATNSRGSNHSFAEIKIHGKRLNIEHIMENFLSTAA